MALAFITNPPPTTFSKNCCMDITLTVVISSSVTYACQFNKLRLTRVKSTNHGFLIRNREKYVCYIGSDISHNADTWLGEDFHAICAKIEDVLWEYFFTEFSRECGSGGGDTSWSWNLSCCMLRRAPDMRVLHAPITMSVTKPGLNVFCFVMSES